MSDKFRQFVRLAAQQAPEMDESSAQPGVSEPGARNIPKGHKYDPKALKPLARMLWAMSVSMGHALQAYRTLNKIKSSTVSPDGMLGGRGYVMKVTDLRGQLFAACEALSAISDTIHDEINAPHWKPKLADLDDNELLSIQRLIGESESKLEEPEEGIEEEEEEVEKSGAPSKTWNPKSKEEPGGEEESASDIPSGGDSKFTDRVRRRKEASSGLPETVTPIVDTRDRATPHQDGPEGSFNFDDFGESSPQDWAVGTPESWTEEVLSTSDMPGGGEVPRGFDFGLGGNGEPSRGEGLEGNPLPDQPNLTAISEMPDSSGPARSDYYDGYKPDNEVDANAELPGDNLNFREQMDIELPGVSYRYERPGEEHADLYDGTERGPK